MGWLKGTRGLRRSLLRQPKDSEGWKMVTVHDGSKFDFGSGVLLGCGSVCVNGKSDGNAILI